MKAQVMYLGKVPGFATDTYTFELPADAKVGDLFWDRRELVEVVALGSSYAGPVRTLDRRLERPE